MPACGTIDRVHARIVIGGPSVDGIVAAVNRVLGTPDRVITGMVRAGGAPAGVHVHALDAANKYLSRALTDENGAFTLHVPAGGVVIG
jgi:hypothetical protein